MGVIKQGILGAFSGKVGGVIGGSWKGIAYMRTIPANVTNPRTAAQVAQRTKMTAMVFLAQALLVGIVKPLWDRFANKMSGYNYFVQQNIAQISALGVITYSALRTSIGSLTGFSSWSVAVPLASFEVEVDFDDDAGSGTALGTDGVYVAVYRESTDEWTVSSNVVTRADLSTVVVQSSASVSGEVFHVYISARRADGTLVSNSQYLTLTVS
jgi:hypothetical protein